MTVRTHQACPPSKPELARPDNAPPTLRIGTSGWAYGHWLHRFYPAGLPGREQLAHYAEHFDSVEINYSFYHLPERKVFEDWRRQTPNDFSFAVKASRYLTHMKKLKDPEDPLQRLMERARGLGQKLGPILFQFPHTWRVNLGRLEAFMQALGRYPSQRFAFEFRHDSWLGRPVYELLGKAGAALCLPVAPGMPVDVRLTATWTYVRFHAGQHGIGFADEELSAWARRIDGFLAGRADVYAYFNNDLEGHAVRDAQRLREMLRGASS